MSITEPIVENTCDHKIISHIPIQKKKIATVVDVIGEEIISEASNRKSSLGDPEDPESEKEISLDDIALSQEQKLEVQHAFHILKIYQGKEQFWKKVFGETTGDLFYYNCLTSEKQFEEPSGYVDVMEEPVKRRTPTYKYRFDF